MDRLELILSWLIGAVKSRGLEEAHLAFLRVDDVKSESPCESDEMETGATAGGWLLRHGMQWRIWGEA